MKKTLVFICFVISAINMLAQTDTVKVSIIEHYSLEDLINHKITTADKFEQKAEEVTANVEILSRYEIEKLGFQSLKEILQNITGFYHIEDYYWLGSSNFGVRGHFKTGSFSNIAILINGVSQLSDKYSDYPDVKITLPVEAIERIEIIKGPMAVIYGNGAFFGVVNIITRRDYKTGDEGSQVQASAGSMGTYKASLQVGNNISDLNFKMVASAEKTKGPDFAYTDLTTDTAFLEYVGLDANSTTAGHLDYSNIYTGMQMEYKGLKLDLSFNESNKGVYDGAPVINHGNNLNTTATNLLIEYRKKVAENFELTANFAFFNHSHTLNYEQYYKYYYEIDNQKTNSYLFEVLSKWTPSAKLSMLSGISRRTVANILQLSDFAYYGLNYGDGKAGLPPGDHYSTYSLFGELSYQLHPAVKFTIGARMEYLESYNMYIARGVVSEDTSDHRPPIDPANRYTIESEYKPANNGLSVVPRGAVIFEPFSQFYIKLLYGEALKQPSFSENYRQLPQGRPPLNPSKIRTFEANVYTFAFEHIILSSSFFYNQLNNLIELTNVLNTETGEWEIYSTNSGKQENYGVEASILLQPVKNLNLKLRGMYQHTNDLRPGYQNIEPAYSPPFLGYINLLYQCNDWLSVGANFRYVSGMKTIWVTDSLPEAGNRLSVDVDPYAIVDINLRAENLFKRKIYTAIKFNNILNTEYRYPTTKSNSWIDKGVPGARFSFLVSAGIKF